MCLALIACAVPLSFAERYDKQNEVTSIEELEFPLRRISYSEFRDDFDRVVADGIREEVKKLYEEQEAAKELTSADEIVPPVTAYYESDLLRSKGHKTTFFYKGDWYSGPEKIVFYDGLGRKISDSIARDAKKLYEKQERLDKWSPWRYINIYYFWYRFFQLIKRVIYLAVFILAGTFVWREIKRSQKTALKP